MGSSLKIYTEKSVSQVDLYNTAIYWRYLYQAKVRFWIKCTWKLKGVKSTTLSRKEKTQHKKRKGI